MKTNIALIRELTYKGLLTQYSQYLVFKHRFSNSLYYNFNINKTARISGISHCCTKKRVNAFMRRGWCYLEHGHLKFVSRGKLCELEGVEAKSTNLVQISTNYKEVKQQLQRLLLEDNIRKQEYIIRIQQDLTNPTNLRAYKAAKRKAARYNIQPGETAGAPMISLQSMATIFNCSKTTAQSIKRHFIKNRWFGFIKQIQRLAEKVSDFEFKKFWRPYYNQSVYLFKGIVYKSMPSWVMILDRE